LGPQTSTLGKGILLPKHHSLAASRPSAARFVCLDLGPGVDSQGEGGDFLPQTAAGQNIEMPGRSKVGFITQFPAVCCYLLIANLDSGFSCGYVLWLING